MGRSGRVDSVEKMGRKLYTASQKIDMEKFTHVDDLGG